MILEDIRRRHLGELGPNFDHLLVLGLFVEMLSIGFSVIVRMLRVVVVVVVLGHVGERGTVVDKSVGEVELCHF